MDRMIEQIFAPFDAPGVPGAAVAVIRNGEIEFAKGYGLANLETREPVRPDTNFRIASVSKQFTAMAIMILKERGLISYDDPLTKFFPNFSRIGREFTVRRLLHHTTGVLDYEKLLPEDLEIPVRDRDVLNMLSSHDESYFKPGTQYRYSNTGYAFLAQIVEATSELGFANFLHDNIFKPLGMDGSVALEEGVSSVERRAYGYAPRKTSEAEDAPIEFVPRDQSMESHVLGDGGVYTSVLDYYKWDQALYGEELVSRATLEEAFTPNRLPSGKSTGYGFGWRTYRWGDAEEMIDIAEIESNRMLNDDPPAKPRPLAPDPAKPALDAVKPAVGCEPVRIIYHNGWTCGFGAGARRAPEKRLTVVALSNRASAQAREAAELLLDKLLAGGLDDAS